METSKIILISIIILIILLIGIYYSEKEHFDFSNILTGIVGGGLLYLCSPCICFCCSFIILIIIMKLLR